VFRHQFFAFDFNVGYSSVGNHENALSKTKSHLGKDALPFPHCNRRSYRRFPLPIHAGLFLPATPALIFSKAKTNNKNG